MMNTTKYEMITKGERLRRCRERNRMHARKTRARKKEHMQHLQNRAAELKEQQLKLRQVINEKNTASILVGLFAKETKDASGNEDPRVEQLLIRPAEEIPDSSKVSELPALILPGQRKKSKRSSASTTTSAEGSQEEEEATPLHETPDDGFDYDLLGKDRSKCTKEELDKIRRERNRMHAKRTRDRKRMFMEEMEGIIKELQTENELLQSHLVSLGGKRVEFPPNATPVSPALAPSKSQDSSAASQIKSLLLAAGEFDQLDDRDTVTTTTTEALLACAVSASTGGSGSSSICDPDDVGRSESPAPKRQRLENHLSTPGVPSQITTTTSAATLGY